MDYIFGMVVAFHALVNWVLLHGPANLTHCFYWDGLGITICYIFDHPAPGVSAASQDKGKAQLCRDKTPKDEATDMLLKQSQDQTHIAGTKVLFILIPWGQSYFSVIDM